ncbi:MAG: hypothetical protein JST00_13260 [Deltaproteobacteria bacterium]|nr:hypothetical protein [Deltaproteobacteria bacterium]
MRLRSLAFLPFAAVAAFAVHCGGGTTNVGGTPPDAGTVDDGGGKTDAGDPGNGNPEATGNKTASKVDLLLVVDDSASMGDKAGLLAQSAGKLIEKLAASGDLHVGVVSSSLGSFGGDVCPAGPTLDRRAHLQTTAIDGSPVAGASKGFLSFTAGGDLAGVVADAKTLVNGVGQSGCGLEAQLETMYRFLSAPDPSLTVRLENNQARYDGLDKTLLLQRAAFLRPDSLVVVVMLTDETDSSVDPYAVGGQGWAFMSNQFPGSTVFRSDGRTTTAPRATSACKSNPASPDCTSCGFALTCTASDPACQKLKNDPECQKNGGYYGPAEDPLNIRFHRMKERFGIDPQFPISRYVDALTRVRVPRIADEHEITEGGPFRTIGAYRTDVTSCTNPLFAANLPTLDSDEICKLPVGPRDKDLVVFAILGGVAPNLVGATGTPASWDAVTGASPATFDFTGIDAHMIESAEPRQGLPPPSSTRGDNGSDPIHGREWATGGEDLQYACTFSLPTPRTCAANDPSCECAGSKLPPLCGATPGQQIKAKAYPATRQLLVARGLGERGVVGSICPTNVADGYDGTMNAIAARVGAKLVK